MTRVQKTKVLLLVVVVLPLCAANTFSALDGNLNAMMDQIPKVNRSIAQNRKLKDVFYGLVEGVKKCGDAFFCKVHDVLLQNNISRWEEEKLLVQNLKQYIVRRNVNCIVVLQNATISNITKPLAFLLEDIASCVRYCNLHGGR